MLLTKQSLAVAHAASKDPSRYALTGVLVECDGQVTATDGHILVSFSPDTLLPDADFPAIEGMQAGADPLHPTILPAPDALKLAREHGQKVPAWNQLQIDTDYSNGNGSARLAKSDGQNTQVFYLRKIEGEFPDYSRFIPPRADELEGERMQVSFTLPVFLKLLTTLAALGVKIFDVQIPDDPVSPVRVDGKTEQGTVVAVIMPCRRT